MGYIGPIPAQVPLTSSDIEDGIITAPKLATDSVEEAKVKALNITNAKIAAGTIDVTAKITGKVPAANLGTGTASATTYLAGDQSYKALSEFDDDNIKNDIATLVLHQATNANAAKYNLVNTNVDQYEDSTGVTSFTDCQRDTSGEYISTGTYDPEGDANCVLLLHMDDTDLSDDSQNTITITKNGGMSRSGTESKFGSYSAFFDGTDDYLSTPDLDTVDGTVTTPTTGDFTIDAWFKQTREDGEAERYWSFGNNGTPPSGSAPMFTCGYNGSAPSTTWNTYGNPGGNINITFPTESTGWHHIAAMRSSTTTYYFYDGVRKATVSIPGSNDMQYSSGTAFIGIRSGTASEYYTGYVDEFRYSNTARYSTSGSTGDTIFTPPTSAYGTTTFSATGNYISTATTANASISSMGAVITYTNAYGTNVLNTDIVLEVSANGGTNYTTAVLTAGGTFSTGILQAVANDITVTPGTSIQYRISFANQVSTTKEARINGASLMY